MAKKKIDAITDQQLNEVAGYKNYSAGLCEALDVLLLFKCGNSFKTKKANVCEPTGDPKNPMRLSYKAAAINDLNITVLVGFVTGVIPHTTPIGSAISVIPVTLSSEITPTVFTDLMLF